MIMRQIPRNKGITLIELLLYMSLFTVLILIVFSTVFYVQRIFADKKGEYIIRTQVHDHMRLLQQHLMNTEYIALDDDELTLYMYTDPNPQALTAIHQYIEEERLILEYFYNNPALYKKIVVFEFSRFERFGFVWLGVLQDSNTVSRQSLLNVSIVWKNNAQKIIYMYEDIYIPNTP